MNWSDQIFLGNSIEQWLWTIGIIVLMLLLKNKISNAIAALIFIPIQRQWKSMIKSDFTGLIVQPLGIFIFILVAFPVMENLIFPKALNASLNNITLQDVMIRVSRILIIFSFSWVLIRFIDFVAMLLDHNAKSNKDKRDDQMIVFLRDFIKVILYIATFLLLLKIGFHVNVGAVLTGLSIVGAALALAAKESIENLIASFIIFFDKPFFTGDQVKVNNASGTQGTIENIGLRSTRIRTPDQTLITVPNKQMVDSVVDNLSMRNARKAEWMINLDLQNSSEKIQSFMDSLSTWLSANKSVTGFTIWLSDIHKNQLCIQLECLTAPVPMEEFQQIKQEINWEIKNGLDDHELKMVVSPPLL
jgi:MscS family membrane protein